MLTELSLEQNLISKLPNEIGQLKRLALLNISAVPLFTMDAGTIPLARVKTLLETCNCPVPNEYEGNLIKAIDKGVREFGIENFGATAIDDPKDVQKLNKYMEKMCPRLKTFPAHIFQLGGLKELFLCNHHFTEVPEQLGIIHKLREPVVKLQSGFKECKRTKLMLVGLGGAGKTSLVRALLSGKYKTKGTGDEEITDGIDIAEWSVRIPMPDSNIGQTINYSVWDFAGQSVYYNTHQVFRTDLPKEELKTTFPAIQHFCHICSLTGEGIEELAKKLFDVTLVQKYMGEKVPSIYLELEKFILLKRKNQTIISYSEVQTHALSLGLAGNSEVREALTFLHELGSLQYFPSEFLRDRVVINPQWLVDVMSCLISVKESVIKDGRFKRKDIAKIWSKYEEGLHLWLLRLTEEFDLTYALPTDDINVVPCLLPEQQPDVLFEWPKLDETSGNREMKMTYRFEYLPTGLFNRTQTRLCQYSDSSAVWKKGSVLRKNCHLALIRQSRSRELIITVQGPRPENILLLVHEVIDSLVHEFFQGVSFDLFIPCVDCVSSGTQDPHMFSAKHVRRAAEMKAPFLQCGKSFHIVALNALQQVIPPANTLDYERYLGDMMHDLKTLRDHPKIT